jgi:hypothetical protein
MVFADENCAVFVVLGPGRALWPEPLQGLVERGQIRMEAAGSVHEAAGRVAGGAEVRGVLIDPAVLTKRDVAALGVMGRFVASRQISMVMLPLTADASPRARDLAGAMRWEEGAGVLEALAMRGAAAGRVEEAMTDKQVQEAYEDIGGTPMPRAMADNGLNGSGTMDEDIGGTPMPRAGENSVTGDVAARYDDFGNQPLVSEEEMQALLGMP